MAQALTGIHHVTAIAGDPQVNLDFYTGTLGLRLVKLTVNFDDPGAYHFYYGNGAGDPGTILTFFAWPGAFPGRRGVEQVTTTAFNVPVGSLEYWRTRLEGAKVRVTGPFERFGEGGFAFSDPDGLELELIASPRNDSLAPWDGNDVPAEHAIRGIHSVSMSEEGYERTAGLLTQTLGFRQVNESGNRFRYEAGEGGPSALVDLLCSPDGQRGRMGIGTVHHVAWRTPDDEAQREWHRVIAGLGYNVSPILDRSYFHSIYFREPGGVLFEIATDPPGFTADEPLEALGTALKLPPWMEAQRAEIEQAVLPLRLPGGGRIGVETGPDEWSE